MRSRHHAAARTGVPVVGQGETRIAFGAAGLDPGRPGGLDRYSLEVLKPLLAACEHLTAYTAAESLAQLYPAQVRRVRPRALGSSTFKGNLLRLLWHQLRLPRMLRREGASLFYSPVPEGMLHPICPQVVTVHDLIPLLYPDDSPRQRYYFRHVLPRIVQASSAVVVTSESTRADLRRCMALGETPVHVIYQGYREDVFQPQRAEDVERVERRYGLRQFVLAVGETRPNKNLPRLISAFARVPLPEIELVLVGRVIDPTLLALPGALGVGERVRFLGRVPDEDLAALYAAARVFVFPSLYEGFGIPPLEAMACGSPVVAARRASIPEVCGEAAAYVDPESVESIAAGMYQVLADPQIQEALRRRGREQATGFSYARAASQILDIIHGVAEERYRGSREPVDTSGRGHRA